MSETPSVTLPVVRQGRATDLRCAVCGAHRPSDGHVLCERCADAYLDDLAEVETRWPMLDANPGKAGNESGRGAPGFHSQSPGSVHVMSMRDPRSKGHAVRDDPECEEKAPPPSVLAVLRTQATIVRVERAFRGITPNNVADCITFLRAQHDWITRSREWAPALCQNMRDLRLAIQRATGVRKPKPIGKCIEYVDDEHMCMAPIYMPETEPRGRDESVRDMPPVQCSRCGSVYDGRRLIVLRLSWEQAA